MSYGKVASSNGFYIVRAELIHEGSTDWKAYVHGSVTPAAKEGEGPVTQAKGLFVVPKNYDLTKVKDGF